MARIVVIGAGVAGLAVALGAARSGHRVTIVERDDTPLPTDPHGAFDWDRRGAPQVRHSHAFLARLRNLLRDRYPDVLAALHDAGATEMRFVEMLPEGMDRTPRPGDEDLVALACRRTTFEWVLRRIALAGAEVELLHGTPVTSLRASSSGPAGIPIVDGVVLADGTVIDADVVVAAGGRRQDVPSLLGALGIGVREVSEDTGIIYTSRFFRLLDGVGFPPQVGPIGGDLGYLKYGVFPGDNRTFSITLAVGTHDDELRRRLLDGDTFIATARSFPATAAYVEDGRSEPITGVEVMGGLINRRRRFLDESSRPVVLGFHAVGDAHTATNPLYGRGCSLAVVQAQALVEHIDAAGTASVDDHLARAVDYEHTTKAEITPWYRAAVEMDRLGRMASTRSDDVSTDPNRSVRMETSPGTGAGDTTAGDTGAGGTAGVDHRAGGTASEPDGPGRAEFARSLLRDGLVPAMRVDPVVLRAFLRMFNLLDPPDALVTNPDVVGRVLAVYQDKDRRAPEPDLGPDRVDLLARL